MGTNISEPLISVIVPLYNHEDFVLDCLASIHDQTYRNIELVVIDDCSSDNSFSRAKRLLETRFGTRFQAVHVLKNSQNLGAHGTINRGISLSSGQFISVINSDDLYHPERLESILRLMQEGNSELGFSLVDVISDAEPGQTQKIPDDFLLYPHRLAFLAQRDPTLGFALLRQNIAVSTGNLVFSRALYDRVGPFLDLKYCHDWYFVLQSLFYTEPVMVLEPLYLYRVHASNSFSSLGNLAGLETEVVLRAFLRHGLVGKSVNPLFPSRQNWPGFFEAFIREAGFEEFYHRENGQGGHNWRVYDIQPSAPLPLAWRP